MKATVTAPRPTPDPPRSSHNPRRPLAPRSPPNQTSSPFPLLRPRLLPLLPLLRRLYYSPPDLLPPQLPLAGRLGRAERLPLREYPRRIPV